MKHVHCDHDHDHDHDHDVKPHSSHRHHGHHHGHCHAPADYGTAFAVGTALNLGFVAVEFVFGALSHSLALVADAGHNLSDVAGLLLAWGATVLARRIPTARRTYGLRRATILASLANAALLFGAVGVIVWEAAHRFVAPEGLSERTMIIVATVGIAINTATALLFVSGRKGDVNIRATFWHMAADALVSLGVVVAGCVIWATGWVLIDPIISLVISLVIAAGSWSVLRDSINLALDAVPEGVDPAAVRRYLAGLPACRDVRDLHIWGLSTTETALTVRLIADRMAWNDALLAKTARELRDRFGIAHATLQIEDGEVDLSCGCGIKSAEVVREQIGNGNGAWKR